MEVPDLLTQRLDGEPRREVVLDGEDVAVVTRDRTFIYREEGLLSDATIEAYGNDVERVSVSQGRRKTTFRLEYIDDTRQFAVANNRAEAMLGGILEGILASAGVLEGDEGVRGVYLFSDLTVAVTDARLVKHIGASVWDSDAEVYSFDAVTGLDFEEGEVSTQVVLWVEGRAERIKTPSDEAPLLQRTLTRALCAFYGVDSLEQLNDAVGTETDDPAPNSSVALEDGISPLIETTDDSPADDTPTDTAGAVTDDEWLEPDTGRSRTADTATADAGRESGVGEHDRPADDTDTSGTGAPEPDTEALERRLRELTRAVERQNELLERQTHQLAELAERVDSE
jgi:hypothetical protein